MQYRRFTRVWLVGSMLSIFLVALTASASSNGREFSGYFDVSGVLEQGDMVQVTLHLKLFNHGTEDAKSVIVTLVDSAPTMTFRGNFKPVRIWKSQKFLEMSQEFTITQREFKEWMQPPAQPNLVILYQDNSGTTWQKGAQISRRPLVPRS